MITYELEPNIVLPAYNQVHKWLNNKTEGRYKEASANIAQAEKSLPIAGAFFDSHSHLHTFKVQSLLDGLISEGKMPYLFVPQVRHVVVDIACGSGAATIGLINTLSTPTILTKLPRPFDVFFVGLDVDEFGLEIYTQFLKALKPTLAEVGINIDFRCVHRAVPEGIYEVINRVNEYKSPMQTPRVTNFVLFQVNAVKPFNKLDKDEMTLRGELESWGIPLGDETNTPFTKQVISSYEHMYRNLNVDIGTFFLIGTKEKHSSQQPQQTEVQWKAAIKNMGAILSDHFSSNGHLVENWTNDSSQYSVAFLHPYLSRRVEQFGSNSGSNNFFADIKQVRSRDLISDETWGEITSLENLKLAWVRSRHYLLRESLVNQIEILEFEHALDENLGRLQMYLRVYFDDIAQSNSRLPYSTPKKWNESHSQIIARPRVLTRFEEDIISVAIVQTLGYLSNISNSFEYRLESRSAKTEYLYEHYLKGYQKYVHQVRSEAERYRGKPAKILLTDIKSFYTEVSQHLAVENVTDQTQENTSRVKWLLEQLLKRPIPETIENIGYHRPNHGLVQGGTASGFFAKLYLRSLHAVIGETKKGIELYRYADDIAVVMPNGHDEQLVRKELSERLTRLELRLSEEKTIVHSPEELLDIWRSQDDLSDIDSQIKEKVLNPIYAMNLEYRQYFDQSNADGNWYDAVERYRLCLKQITIYPVRDWLSRKIQEFLVPKSTMALRLPTLHYFINSEPAEWKDRFIELNEEWFYGTLFNMRQTLIEGFQHAYEEYEKAKAASSVHERLFLTRVRFFAGKLAVLGYKETLSTLIKLLKEPGILGNARWHLESIVRQQENLSFMSLLDDLALRKLGGDAYLRSIIAQTIHHLTHDFQFDYSQRLSSYLVDLVTTGSAAEKLMATEALILCIQFPEVDYCQFEALLDTEDAKRYPQLERNLWILIEMYCKRPRSDNLRSLEVKYKIDDEFILQLRKGREHPFVRDYYNSEYPDIDDHGYPYPF